MKSNNQIEQTDRVLLLTVPSSYRTPAFLKAASSLNLEVIQISDMPTSLNDHYGIDTAIDFADIDGAVRKISKIHAETRLTSIVSVDDAATQLAAVASYSIGLPANDPDASVAARDKLVMRTVMKDHGIKCPQFNEISVDEKPHDIASSIHYPCVIKPRRMSGSRGVIRADDCHEFIVAFNRTAAIVRSNGSGEENSSIIVEDYLDGIEVAVEGIITDGDLHILTIFDKPDPLVGPFFEETIYVTPSRHSPEVQQKISDEVAAAAEAVGLRHGPVHAELRVNAEGAWLLEIAGRSIGGL